MQAELKTLGPAALRQFQSLEFDAARTVTERFFPDSRPIPNQFQRQDECREYLIHHLEFLKPVLQFGTLAPMTKYLHWLDSVLTARNVPPDSLEQSLQWLAEYFSARMDCSDAEVVNAALLAARDDFIATSDPASAVAPSKPNVEVAAFQAALLDGDQRTALAIVNRCLDHGRKLTDVELELIQPALYGIGEAWQANEVSVAQEHLATAIVHSIMTVALLRAKPPALNGKRVLLACVAGNQHSVGLRMVADAFQLSGWEVQYLGADVPTGALIEQIAGWSPHIVGLAVSFTQQIGAVKDAIVQINQRFGAARPPVLIGGMAINHFDWLVNMVGADGSGADAQHAVAAAERLVNDKDSRCRGSRPN
ncbi:methanogenic corrinoid protein MtbC1 [Rhodopseudomonas rhenobacensis]|uniref:Methanogenic corrinoid protein MtbC1 n=1 Tax=Rhodopseudomonas rhenobacensis TaxID=87461 RepID=A0A7W7Z421_9BRAD|nr:cobalamin-dependent protein [Rhodopseudomonas rhenobacensis]MBB5047559.1 methanogenic corrinoid protein MtbC1 [Rhodopseudomonas rhenobacensis]